jgi:hypothetical protein
LLQVVRFSLPCGVHKSWIKQAAETCLVFSLENADPGLLDGLETFRTAGLAAITVLSTRRCAEGDEEE